MNRSVLSQSLPLILAALAAGSASCDHKDLDLPVQEFPTARTRVVFDWSHAPDADPASMELCLYPEGQSHHLSFNLSGREGGYIALEPGNYGAVSMNNDDLDWAIYRNTHNFRDFEVYTHDASELGAYKLLASVLPRDSRAAWERLAATPEMSWSTRTDTVTVRSPEMLPEDESGERVNVITLYPEEVVCRYTVEVRDVENIHSARGEVVDGTLSGMAEGYRHGSNITTDTPVTMPFVMNIDYENHTMRGEFYTFGECNTLEVVHILSVYLFLSDGSKWHYTFDVTPQVTEAPDPRRVDIVVNGLTLPKAVSSGGMVPEVNDWRTEEVHIKM